MSWVTIIWAMIVSAGLTLVLVWWGRREPRANLLFSPLAVAVAVLAGCEFWMMRAETPAAFSMALRWLHAPTWSWIVSLVRFVRLYLRAGRLWLALMVSGVRTLSLIIILFAPRISTIREITSLRHVSFLGGTVAVAGGVQNPWMLIGSLKKVVFGNDSFDS